MLLCVCSNYDADWPADPAPLEDWGCLWGAIGVDEIVQSELGGPCKCQITNLRFDSDGLFPMEFRPRWFSARKSDSSCLSLNALHPIGLTNRQAGYLREYCFVPRSPDKSSPMPAKAGLDLAEDTKSRRNAGPESKGHIAASVFSRVQPRRARQPSIRTTLLFW